MLNWSRAIRVCLILGMLVIPMQFTAAAAEVIQGKCLTFNPTERSIVLENEIDHTQATFDLSRAAVGMTPEEGNIIRIAYTVEAGKNMALKVMNVTKQDLRKE